MKAEEFKIGNWVSFSGVEAQVCSIRDDTVSYDGGLFWDNPKNVTPIKMTNDWLTRFNEEQVDEFFELFPFGIQETMGTKIWIVFEGEQIGTNDVYYDYVHQFQNLFSSLTGNDLKLKE